MSQRLVPGFGYVDESGASKEALIPGFGYLDEDAAGANQTISVPAGALTLTGNAPTVVVTSRVSVPAGSLTLTGFAPTVLNPNTVAVPAGSLTLSGFAPTVLVGSNIAVPAGALTLTGNAPTVVSTANNLVSVPAGALILTGYAPTVLGGEQAPRQIGAGKSRKRRRVVEIDGQDFVVRSTDEAVALLDRAKEEAERLAKEAIARAVAAPKRKPSKVLADARNTLLVPQIEAPEDLKEYASGIVENIREIYESAMLTIEIATHQAKRQRQEEDDEDVLLLLI